MEATAVGVPVGDLPPIGEDGGMTALTTLDHVTIVTDDFDRCRAVYDAMCDALGLVAQIDYSDPEEDEFDDDVVAAIGYGPEGGRALLLLVAGPQATRGAHCALGVTERRLVQVAFDAAVAAGARAVQPPREWESRQLGYYGAQLADCAGNLVEVVHRA